jgi:hypothetical protein
MCFRPSSRTRTDLMPVMITRTQRQWVSFRHRFNADEPMLLYSYIDREQRLAKTPKTQIRALVDRTTKTIRDEDGYGSTSFSAEFTCSARHGALVKRYRYVDRFTFSSPSRLTTVGVRCNIKSTISPTLIPSQTHTHTHTHTHVVLLSKQSSIIASLLLLLQNLENDSFDHRYCYKTHTLLLSSALFCCH